MLTSLRHCCILSGLALMAALIASLALVGYQHKMQYFAGVAILALLALHMMLPRRKRLSTIIPGLGSVLLLMSVLLAFVGLLSL